MSGTKSSPFNRVMGAIVPRAVDAIELDDLLERLDLDAVLARVDLNLLLERLDLDALITRIDLDQLMQRVDVDALVVLGLVDRVLRRQPDLGPPKPAGGLRGRCLEPSDFSTTQ